MELHDQHVLEWMLKAVHGGVIKYLHPVWRDPNNCVPRALHQVTGLPPITVYQICKEFGGREHGKGMTVDKMWLAFEAAAKLTGMRVEFISGEQAKREYGKTLLTAERELMAHERVVFEVKGHVIGFHNNASNDTAQGRRQRIKAIYRFKEAA